VAGIRGVIFDFGGVITENFDPDTARAYELELGLEPDTLAAAIFDCEPWLEVSQGRISEELYRERFGAGLPRPVPAERLAALWRFVFDLTGIRPGARELIAATRARGFRVALLSNERLSLRATLERWDLAPLFDCIVISAEVGMRKPDPAIYRHAAEGLALPAGTCVFIDDREGNVLAAREVGMHALRFESLEQLRPALDGLLSQHPAC
jgi:putative hydrolase of the HAD superfamily